MRFLCDIFLLAGFFYLCASDPPPVSPARNVQPPVDSNEKLDKTVKIPKADNVNPNPQDGVAIDSRPLHPKQGKLKPKGMFSPIASSDECSDDVRRICGSSKYKMNNNLDILTCLVNNADNDDISVECNQYLWQFKANVTQSSKFGKLARQMCPEALEKLPVCKEILDDGKPDGKLPACLMENRDAITSQTCLNFLTKIQSIIFSDFHLICTFIGECKADITRYKCGKLDSGQDSKDFAHSQGDTVACLQKKLTEKNEIAPKCYKELTRLAELSAEDYHLDRHLYFRCKHDREVLCPQVIAGRGRVYQCLYEHKFDQRMSAKCREALTARQKVEAVDYKANYPLVHKCKEDIEKRHCEIGALPKQPNSESVIHLSSILLCLEKDYDTNPLAAPCEEELVELRQMLMEDFELSPEITHHCAAEIQKDCGGVGKEGKTIHCLMGLAQIENKLNKDCEAALMELVKEADAMDNYRIDPVLARSCQLAISTKCSSDQTKDSEVLSCLMDHINDHDMKKKCKNALLEIQYFVSRDFTLDRNFRTACKNEVKRCYATDTGAGNGDGNDDESMPIPFSLVVSCLYGQIHNHIKSDFSDACKEEVHRVIKQRALDFHLNPMLEENCRQDLSKYCSDTKMEQGEEFVCLQDNFDQLSSGCKDQVTLLTKEESKNVQDFDNILIRECEPMMQEFCKDFTDEKDEGELMECLIRNKENMESEKCAAGITHFQLIEMKNYHFSYKFVTACERDITQYCKEKKTKSEVVSCLSELVRNRILSEDNLKDQVQEVSQKCREELKFEKLQMHKNIELNPELEQFCRKDYEDHCRDVKSGHARIIECLRKHKNKLNPGCYKHLFQFEKDESLHPKMDYVLMKRCKSDIMEYCRAEYQLEDAQKIIECLMLRKRDLQSRCRSVLLEREKEMFSDIELNVDVQKNCKKDINKFCKEALKKAKELHEKGEDPHGVVYECLTDIFVEDSKEKALSDLCYRHIETVIREEDEEYELNPQLALHCVDSISKLCPPENVPNVVQCLKDNFLASKLTKEPACSHEIAKLLTEGQSDIKADPMLEKACSLDLQTHCSNVVEGHGNKVSCLLKVLQSDPSFLNTPCHEALSSRKKMWELAGGKSVKDLSDLSHVVWHSEQSSYLLTMLIMIFLLILMTGTVCGRLSKRVSVDRKTR